MMRRDLLLVGAVLTNAAAAIVACGSESGAGADLTNPDASSEAASSGGDGASGSSGSSGSSGTSGGPRPADDAGVTADGGVDPPDAGPGGDTTRIACGATSCPIPAETCCVSELNTGGDTSFSCVAGATCPPVPGGGDTAALKCSSGANCPSGTVCCIRVVAGDHAASECKAACGSDEARLCDLKAGDAGCTPAEPCSNSNIDDWGKLPETYATCGGKQN